jgi:hypothetical protein
MVFDLKYVILIYIILLVILFVYKPTLLKFEEDNRKKTLYLISLVIIIAIITFYIKILFEWFF